MFNQSTFENHHSQSFPDESNMTLGFTPSSGNWFYPKLRQGRDKGGNGEEEKQGSTLG